MSRDAALEMWGGVECSVVRIGDETRNQLLDTGHFHRLGDLDLIAGLEIEKLRYPVLWDVVRHGSGQEDWSWPDQRLRRLLALGIKPIAGLLHHGSGPRVDLLDPEFPQLFADYAQAVAQRYPWIEAFTPINEPMTTARASGLYGLWHPHGLDEACCFRLLVAQCRAIAKAMAAIRKVNPAAQLVQTEDFGRTFATEPLHYQADYENERRWLAIDLLTGRVDRRHPFHERLAAAGVAERDLAALASEPCPPDIIGIDYYLTSDRFLDHRIDLYPSEQIGGNGLDVYVDIAAFRSEWQDCAGVAKRLEEIWQRYRLPLAVTELHNGCTREEQLRWLVEGWEGARQARRAGADVRAVTAWALFGMMDWNSLLVERQGHYENGAFDCRSTPPRPTAIAAAIASLAKTGSFDHPSLDRPGWWRPEPRLPARTRPLLLVGAGPLTETLKECCHARRLSFLSIVAGSEARDVLASTDAWAAICVEPRHPPWRLSCDGHLAMQASDSLERRHLANALLDLVLDGLEGAAKLTRADAANQYEFMMLRSTCET
jgi:dTDP-4-dehydrorhamnose reductase